MHLNKNRRPMADDRVEVRLEDLGLHGAVTLATSYFLEKVAV